MITPSITELLKGNGLLYKVIKFHSCSLDIFGKKHGFCIECKNPFNEALSCRSLVQLYSAPISQVHMCDLCLRPSNVLFAGWNTKILKFRNPSVQVPVPVETFQGFCCLQLTVRKIKQLYNNVVLFKQSVVETLLITTLLNISK